MTHQFRSFGLAILLSLVPVAAVAEKQADRMKECLTIDDMTKDRLDCFDAIIPPEPKPTKAKAKTVSDCRFLKEEDERLTCFNKFAETKPKPTAKKKKEAPPRPQ